MENSNLHVYHRLLCAKFISGIAGKIIDSQLITAPEIIAPEKRHFQFIYCTKVHGITSNVIHKHIVREVRHIGLLCFVLKIIYVTYI